MRHKMAGINPRRTVFPSLFWWLVLVVSVAEATANSSSTSTAAETTIKEDDDGGVLESVFPFKALQLYNAVTGYLEYLFDTVIAPITGKWNNNSHSLISIVIIFLTEGNVGKSKMFSINYFKGTYNPYFLF